MLTIDAQTAFHSLHIMPSLTSVVTVDILLCDCFSSEEGFFPVAVIISTLLVVLVHTFQIKSLF